jgi:hypothetical protein
VVEIRRCLGALGSTFVLVACAASHGAPPERGDGGEAGALSDAGAGHDASAPPDGTAESGGADSSVGADSRAEASAEAGIDSAFDATAPGDGGSEAGKDADADAGHVELLSGVVAVASNAFAYHNCALLTGGTVACWGDNAGGELGIGTTTGPDTCSTGPCSRTPVAVPGVTGVAQVSVGPAQTYAVLTNGTVMGWGSLSGSPTPAPVSGLAGVASIAASATGFYAVLTGGAVLTWSTSAPMPTPVASLAGVTAIAGGGEFFCALLSGGTVECEGDNDLGELGDGTINAATSPTPVTGLAGVTAITASMNVACAMLSSGAVECWGSGAQGELGSGNMGPDICAVGCLDNCPTCAESPVQAVSGGATSLAAGWLEGACASLSSGAVQCWGDNTWGTLGDGTTNGPYTCGGGPCSLSPVPASGITNAKAVSAGYLWACALLSGGTVACWGSNEYGGLGDGSATDSDVPVMVTQ